MFVSRWGFYCVILASGSEITGVHMQMFHLLVTALFEYEYKSDPTVGGQLYFELSVVI